MKLYQLPVAITSGNTIMYWQELVQLNTIFIRYYDDVMCRCLCVAGNKLLVIKSNDGGQDLSYLQDES